MSENMKIALIVALIQFLSRMWSRHEHRETATGIHAIKHAVTNGGYAALLRERDELRKQLDAAFSAIRELESRKDK